ncbi:deoxyribodipyrimidine photo-lyase [Endozoicomonas sp. G2_1]|uniref:deoxyribodipyrimidine photo-lyase n=1 Tax=Endozoicomonas sp. G2_1 TaxID=2821091 RepID=UPI001ADCD3C3|nr:deoxyribodipyrimidine photo-lyase [Endozoicomonas sp. G2_1]MBO9491175.1 deoxyribodipyrimidine photo-lyase [Endozoicomonas sp. G2_1]
MNNHSLLWFRRDIRLDDNPAFNHYLQAIETAPQTHNYAIFVATPEQWRKHNVAGIQIDLVQRHLQWLKQQLKHYQITLKIIEATNFHSQVAMLSEFCQQHHISQVFANGEPEINELARDQAAHQQLATHGCQMTVFEADVIVDKGSVLNKQGEMFKVFTPFKKAWLNQIKQYGLNPFPSYERSPTDSDNQEAPLEQQNADSCQAFNWNYPITDSSKWPLIDDVKQQVLPLFFRYKLAEYHNNRDIPGIKGTSGLSPYFAIGALSARQVCHQLLQQCPELLDNDKLPQFSWLNELIWRDFYRHLLFHYPNLCKHQNFNQKFDALPWPNDQQRFDAWCQGKTGYPIVDAAMRQLTTTGWMHNRLRMIVASFLTKHLLIDWRLGEKFFNQHLIDGDFAANNGGWQWSAGTGCDAQPYFRIFNPISQSEKFDPEGKFIRKYLPQLAKLPNKEIHFPHKYLAQVKQTDYWPAIVDHKSARLAALDFYKV